MDHRTILAFAAVIFAAGYFVRSFQPANAFPQGPNVSIGSNPIDNSFATCSGGTIFTNNTTHDFIITDITRSSRGYGAYLMQNNQIIWESQGGNNASDVITFKSGISISPGASVQCNNGGHTMTISGYYTH